MRSGTHSPFSNRVRLLLLLEACEYADIAPVSVGDIHALAFLADLLAPVWSQDSYERKILKARQGPFYRELQRELDCLVGLGLVEVHDISYKRSHSRWELAALFSVNFDHAEQALRSVQAFSTERETSEFLRSLVLSVARTDTAISGAAERDVTWSDKRTSVGDVIDFAEWKEANYTAAAANFFDRVAPHGLRTTQGEKLQLYMRLLEERIAN